MNRYGGKNGMRRQGSKAKVAALALAGAVGLGWAGSAAFGQLSGPNGADPLSNPQPPAVAPPAPAPTDLATPSPARAYPDLESALRGLREARTPDEAVDAYSAGSALDR